MGELPEGMVTFLFTDIEGSTRLLDALGADAYGAALADHRRLLRDAFTAHGGVEVDTQGDAFFVVFADATAAVAAARRARQALAEGPINVRMGLHSGTPRLTAEGYVGHDVHLGARIAAAGHGGQVLLSKATREAVGDTLDVLDLGEHRVKDFAEPVWIHQLGTERFPPLKTISNTNLPRPTSTFVGRETEVGEITSVIRDGARLLTLSGPGGTGKTRLSIEVGAELVPEFKAGVFWVALAALRDPALVVDQVAQTIGAKDGLIEHIGERQMLLVLDNLEQVVEAAPDLANIVEACANLHLLITSRERLRVRGEVEYAVPPLTEREAVDLFTQRSGITADATIGELCRRLDNLPLAVELAAARTTVLSPAQILERLAKRLDLLKGGRDAEARQQTLRATIEWSYELLTDDEKQLFTRLSVFAGGCTLEAAEEVAGADLDTLQSLVDKSLVRHTDDRFWMLETIRAFAAERFEGDSERDAVRDRHIRHFVDLTDQAWRQRTTNDAKWLPVIASEHDNLRAALARARECDPRAEAALAGAAAIYLSGAGFAGEVRSDLDGALTRYTARDRVRARALTHRGEVDDSLPFLEQALGVWREIGDKPGEALVLESIGWYYDTVGDYPAARAAHVHSLDVLRETGTPEIEGGMARAGLCHVLIALNEVQEAQLMAHELLVIAERYGGALMRQLALHFLADCSLLRSEYDEAERRYLRALAYAREIGRVGRAIDEVVGVAMSRAGQRRFVDAVRLASAARAEQEELGRSDDHWWKSMQDRFIGEARVRLSQDECELAEKQGRATQFEAVVDELLTAEASTDR